MPIAIIYLKIEIPKISKFIKDNMDAKVIEVIALNKDNSQDDKTFNTKDSSTVKENIQKVKQWIRDIFIKNNFHFDPFQNFSSK